MGRLTLQKGPTDLNDGIEPDGTSHWIRSACRADLTTLDVMHSQSVSSLVHESRDVVSTPIPYRREQRFQ
jgi:hypothetical protein